MGSEDGEVYVMRDEEGDGEWVSPTPAGEAVVDAVTEATDLAADDLDPLDSYVDPADLRAVLSAADDSLSFAVEGHEVTVDSDGDISVG